MRGTPRRCRTAILSELNIRDMKDRHMISPLFLQRISAAAVVLTSVGFLSACHGDNGIQVGQIVGGATKQMRDVEPVGGFLPEPTLLSAGGQGRSALMYRNPGVNLAAYNSLILDPVTIWTGPNSTIATVPEEQRQALANTFTSDLYQALKTKCKMTRQSGPGTAHMKIALVDATTTNAGLTTIATYVPYVSAAYAVASTGFNSGVGYFAGSATIEGYAVDSTNGTVLWQAVDKRGGTTALVKDTLDSQLDIHHAFQAWSQKMLAGLQQLGICTS